MKTQIIALSIIVCIFIGGFVFMFNIDRDEPVEQPPHTYQYDTAETFYLKSGNTELIYEYSYSGAHIVQLIRDNEPIFIVTFEDRDTAVEFMEGYVGSMEVNNALQ